MRERTVEQEPDYLLVITNTTNSEYDLILTRKLMRGLRVTKHSLVFDKKVYGVVQNTVLILDKKVHGGVWNTAGFGF